MTLEKLAVLAIALFAFMALVNMLSGVRALKRSMRFKPERIRRLIGGKDSARAAAESIIRDIATRFPDEVETSRKQGSVTSSLNEALERARAYYLSRVEAIHKPLFNESVDKIILKKRS